MKKIMFNDKYELTEAVLSGRKTQTRRIIPQSVIEKVEKFGREYFAGTLDSLTGIDLFNHYFFTEKIGRLPFSVGEVVAIAQAYRDTWQHTGYMTEIEAKQCAGYSNKMFVSADLMPHRIRITSVRVERLQDISDEDCIKEGVREVCVNNNWGNSASHWEFQVSYEDKFGRTKLLRGDTPQEAYAALIDRISGKGTWASNPIVFAYDFELAKR